MGIVYMVGRTNAATAAESAVLRGRGLTVHQVPLSRLPMYDDGDFYHAHATWRDMLLTMAYCRITGKRFYGDYNDIINASANGHATGEAAYYEQDIWTRDLSDIDRERLDIIAAMIPPDTTSILDAGCGNGKVSDHLTAYGYAVTGLDMSTAALKQVSSPAIRASVTRIPARDRSFDAVVSTELLEHLPPADYSKAIEELARIARNAIVLELPNAQQLSHGTERCSRCGARFHANHHYRNFYGHNTYSLPRFSGFHLADIRYSTSPQFRYNPVLLRIRQRLAGVYMKSPIAYCTACGTRQFATGLREYSAIYRSCAGMEKRLRKHRTNHWPSQVFLLYRRQT